MLARFVEDLGGLLLALVLLFFMLSRREDMRNRLIRLAGDSRITATTKALDEAARRISHYLLMQGIVNGAFGLTIALGLLVIGVPYPLLWGFLGFALRYVPYIGPWIAAVPPTLLGAIMFPGWLEPILVIGLFAVVELIAGNVIEPRLYGRSIGVSEVALLVAAAFWAFLWGPIGLVLSNPITVCLMVLAKNVPHLRFVELLLGDEPALSPDIAYYQRLVAHDRKEALELVLKHVAATLRQRVYDDILASAISYGPRATASRDDLTEEDEVFLLDATRDVMRTVAEQHDFSAAEEAAGETGSHTRVRILTCPARDGADHMALAMLYDMLDPARWEVEIAADEVLTSELVERVAAEHPAAVCICTLAPGGLAQARYLCKRLRSRVPEVKILVGRWGARHVPESHVKQLQESGADLVAATLQETRRQLLALRPVLLSHQSTLAHARCARVHTRSSRLPNARRWFNRRHRMPLADSCTSRCCYNVRRRSHAPEFPQDRQEGPPEDGREGQTLPLRQVPQAQPTARQDARALVLPSLPERAGTAQCRVAKNRLRSRASPRRFST